MTGRTVSPRLLYLGAVPVEASFHGSLLLHRLLSNYPAERLCIVESGIDASAPEFRLPGVRYERWPAPFARAHRSRLAGAARALDCLRALVSLPRRPRHGDFAAEVVLTVAHGAGWIAAARWARMRALPLHLIIHDDLSTNHGLPSGLTRWYRGRFDTVYRQAASRLCVSGRMAIELERRHGTPGTTLLPCRAANAGSLPPAPSRERRPVFAYAGTVNSPGYVRLLRALAGVLATVDCRLDIYGPMDERTLRECGLDLPNIRGAGRVAPDQLVRHLHEHADVLYAPMSFAPSERVGMQLAFPSKLADYTRAGLPILLHAPPDTAALDWAASFPDAAEVVPTESDSDLVQAVTRLMRPEHRTGLASGAREAGDASFAHEAVQAVFRSAIAR